MTEIISIVRKIEDFAVVVSCLQSVGNGSKILIMRTWMCAWILVLGFVVVARAGALESRADALMFPEIAFRETSLTSAVEYLRQATAKDPGGAINLVELYPAEFGEETLITMSLNNVPFSAVLKYVAESAGVAVEYQDHAIVLKKEAIATQ